MRARYYLIAPAGLPNYGDDLIAASWLRHLAEIAPEAEVWVDTHSPGSASVLLAALHPYVHFTDTLWRLCSAAPVEDPWLVSSWVQEAVHNPGMVARLHYGIELLAGADVVHVLGGGYVNRLWPKHIGLLAGAAAAVRRSGGRAAMTGQGLTPACDDIEPLLRALAERFAVVDARDHASAQLLGVATGVDDAFFGIGPRLYAEQDEVPEVMVSLQSDLVDVGVGRLAGAALATLRSWQVPTERVCVVEAIPRVDRDVYAMFEHELPGVRFYPFPDVWDRGLPVAPGQTWIATRFHMHMVAAAGGANGVALPVHPAYYGTKHRSLTELGSGWTLVDDLGRVPARPTEGGFAWDALAEFASGKRALARAIYAPAPHAHAEPSPQPNPPTEPAQPQDGGGSQARWFARRFRS